MIILERGLHQNRGGATLKVVTDRLDNQITTNTIHALVGDNNVVFYLSKPSGDVSPLTSKRSSCGWWVDWPVSEADLHFGLLPWSEPPDLKLLTSDRLKRVFYLPIRGWYKNEWFDGPLAVTLPGRGVVSLVPTSGPARLMVSLPLLNKEELCNEKIAPKWETAIAHRLSVSSLVEAIKMKFKQKANTLGLSSQLPPLYTSLMLILMRLAFPDRNLIIEQCFLQNNVNPGYRRLVQNLGIATSDRTILQPEQFIDLGQLATLIPDNLVLDIIAALCLRSDVIPARLYKR